MVCYHFLLYYNQFSAMFGDVKIQTDVQTADCCRSAADSPHCVQCLESLFSVQQCPCYQPVPNITPCPTLVSRRVSPCRVSALSDRSTAGPAQLCCTHTTTWTAPSAPSVHQSTPATLLGTIGGIKMIKGPNRLQFIFLKSLIFNSNGKNSEVIDLKV